MKISIITICFNAENTIEDTFLSVFNQTYKNIELIVIDGKSTDKTLEIIEKHIEKINYFVSEPDKGVYDAMNKGIKAAQAKIQKLNPGHDNINRTADMTVNDRR